MDADAESQASASGPTTTEASAPDPALASTQANETGAQQTGNAKLRKRTKTGCLTCRRRRIKCGEERPICTNCVRSKRQCEGYNQRLVFKTAMEGWPGMMGPSNIIPHHTSVMPGGQRSDFGLEYGYAERQTHYGIPLDEYGRPMAFTPQQVVSPAWASVPYPYPRMGAAGPIASPAAYSSIPPTPTSVAPSARTDYGTASMPLPSPGPLMSPFYQESPYQHSFDGISPQAQQFVARSEEVDHYPQPHTLPTPATSAYTEVPATHIIHGAEHDPGYFAFQTRQHVPHSIPTPISAPPAHTAGDHRVFGHKPGISRNFSGAPINIESFVPPTTTHYVVDASDYDLNTAAVEWQHDEYDSPWDSDEDAELPTSQPVAQIEHNDEKLKIIMGIGGGYIGETTALSYNSVLYPGFLTEYDAEKFASPLRNPHTARVFAHFLASTASTISIFERDSLHNIPCADGAPGPGTDRGAWTYTLPAMALSHQGLLHAMLSLSSLQISKLQNDGPTPAFKHYGYAIKRINRCVQHPQKRHNVTTLAATLLLAFYEVMTADHTKWCCHLTGAARLLQEIDYAGMAAQAQFAADQERMMVSESGVESSTKQRIRHPHDLNSVLIDKIIGNQMVDPQSHGISIIPFDLPRYQLYQDMFWWYARQDVYQSLIAGNRLLLKYHRWRSCPPRASIGRFDALHGTHDHVILLLGRIAEFSAKDRERKLKVMGASGGMWRPHPDMKMPPRPPTRPMQSRTTSGGPPLSSSTPLMNTVSQSQEPRSSALAMPTFYGMAPMPTKISLPSSYVTHATMPPLESPLSDKPADNLEAQTKTALADWTQMYSALHEMKHHFGPSFEPVDTTQQSLSSPFGPPIVYASQGIAVLWALYYAAHIVALRAHPYMPPFAHVAAGVAAGQTKEYSNTIGRIAAGLMTEPLRQRLSPAIGATFCEVTMPLFIAGIQYTDAAQRHWVVSRTREIENITGWASVGMIGQGCERAWMKTAEAGMGPPYTPQEEFASIQDSSSSMRVSRVGNGRPTTREHWASHPHNEDPRGMRVHLAMGLLSNESDLDAEEQAVRHDQRLSQQENAYTSSASASLAFRPAA